MMKKIKFRGKRLDNSEWCFGYYVYDEILDNHKIYVTEGGNTFGRKVDPETVGGYAGLKDSKDVEIYTDDIVRQTFNGEVTGYQIGKVVILPSQGVCMSFPRTFVETEGNDHEWHLDGYRNVRHYRSEVIGNTTDNPELLLVGKL